MRLDTDYLDKQQRTRRERWRLRLTALAMIACVVMIGDLVATAQPLETDETPVIQCPDDKDRSPSLTTGDRPTLAGVDQDTAFNFSKQTLCSGGK
ncbi:MAG: hypothetical protein AAGC96_10780 [Pseudomonadota bacterium]